ncbi:MAG: hypothetical protein HZC42_00185 [Candidatus Eisenbacteria bacterium]|nr:hypothetical protein [Candidatus Eisenbacteria bacterium]
MIEPGLRLGVGLVVAPEQVVTLRAAPAQLSDDVALGNEGEGLGPHLIEILEGAFDPQLLQASVTQELKTEKRRSSIVECALQLNRRLKYRHSGLKVAPIQSNQPDEQLSIAHERRVTDLSRLIETLLRGPKSIVKTPTLPEGNRNAPTAVIRVIPAAGLLQSD